MGKDEQDPTTLNIDRRAVGNVATGEKLTFGVSVTTSAVCEKWGFLLLPVPGHPLPR